ncbi:hypothetical protein CAPTEDRAFT_207715 [Capitella teleta]|uniref:PARP n=1 Tax=Capitella teleta TaxID=283909 RepID=R7TI08_CAPTE|nr:hypothetical protein CAPTEDRAFT_207715 [Capitella teleta]|eukprot:ELT91186.1 hypothetical protein CAPTEDRAFT_207715 [Capitella teleta]
MSDSDGDCGPCPAKKSRIRCPYGSRCYRKNPQHFKEFSHSDEVGAKRFDSSVERRTLPVCPFGTNCYRKNLVHFAEFSHPTAGSSRAKDDGDDTESNASSSGDEDVVAHSSKANGMLQKSYSQMTEEERKDLITKAIAAKTQLEAELKSAREKVEERERELQRMQDEVNKGVLLMDGEEEALKADAVKYYSLVPERAYKEGSAAQLHFRLAESQFYRLIDATSQRFRVKKVEYVINPALAGAFNQAREDLKLMRGEEMSYPVLAFHGTEEKNITPIVEGGFKVPGEKGFAHRTDSGMWGRGVYFSEYPGYSMAYIAGSTKLLLSQVLLGKKKPEDKRKVVDSREEMLLLYEKAADVKRSTGVFEGTSTKLVGKFVKGILDISRLIRKHGGKCQGSYHVYDHVIWVNLGSVLADRSTAMSLVVASHLEFEKKSSNDVMQAMAWGAYLSRNITSPPCLLVFACIKEIPFSHAFPLKHMGAHNLKDECHLDGSMTNER